MEYRDRIKRHRLLTLILLIGLIVLMLASITLGTVKIPLTETVRIILSKIGILQNKISIEDIKPSNIFIILQIRLPRIILASLVGATLSLVGTSYQAIFKNPKADPFVMGISSGAAFGATIGIVLGVGKGFLGFSGVSIMAFIGALITTWIVYNLARIGDRVSTTSILLAGVVMSAILSSAISLLMLYNQNEISRIVFWTMGSFNGASWEQILIIAIPVFIGLVVLLSYANQLNAIVMGEDDAHNLGVNVELVKKVVLIVSSFLTACAVSVSGIIGFVGLIVPHLFRLIFGANHKTLLPVAAIGGGIFLVLCDTVARTALGTAEIPVGIITSITGGPFFLYILKNSKNNKLV